VKSIDFVEGVKEFARNSDPGGYGVPVKSWEMQIRKITSGLRTGSFRVLIGSRISSYVGDGAMRRLSGPVDDYTLMQK
jgi:hypothetical protein